MLRLQAAAETLKVFVFCAPVDFSEGATTKTKTTRTLARSHALCTFVEQYRAHSCNGRLLIAIVRTVCAKARTHLCVSSDSFAHEPVRVFMFGERAHKRKHKRSERNTNSERFTAVNIVLCIHNVFCHIIGTVLYARAFVYAVAQRLGLRASSFLCFYLHIRRLVKCQRVRFMHYSYTRTAQTTRIRYTDI